MSQKVRGFKFAPTYDGTSLFTGTGNIVMDGKVSVLCVKKASGAATGVTLPASPPTGLRVIVKDSKGDAATNNITVTPAAGTLDGGSNHVINVNYGCAVYNYNGSEWSLLGYLSETAGGNLSVAGNVTLTGLLFESASDALTAAGSSQATGLQLVSEINRVTTTAASTGVNLPASAPGLTIFVINAGASTLTVYPVIGGTETINGVAAGTGVPMMPNSIAIFACSVAGTWIAEGLGGGFSGAFPTAITTATITAHSTGGQANAVQLTAEYNRVSTVAAQGDSVALPASAVGMSITIDNRGANACQVFGNNTAADTINGIATGTGISHGVNQIATYYCAVVGNWEVQFSQAQQPGLVALSGTTDAIPPHVAHNYIITSTSTDNMTLAAPTATTDDGIIISIMSNTAHAHTLTATGNLETGATGTGVLTFAAHAGATVQLMAYQGKWIVQSLQGVTVTS